MITQRYGSLKFFWHHDKMDAIRKGIVTSPIYVRLKPTNHCNHHCSFCSYDPVEGDISVRDSMNNRDDEIPKDKLLEIIRDFRDMGVKAVTFSGGGEPLLHPNISEAMQKSLDYDIDLSIITNGQRLNEDRAQILANAHWVRVSSDASDAKTFSKIRKVPENWFYELTENIEKFSKIKNHNCELGINFVVHQQNFNQVYRSVQHFKNLGVNHVKITPKWVSNFMEYHSSIKDSVIDQIREAKNLSQDGFSVYDTYENDFSMSSVAERNYPRCYIMQIVPVIGANSRVYFCHDKAYSTSGELGSIKDRSFKELWFSETTEKIFKNFDPRKCCKHHCANDSKNAMINSALNCYGDDINFI